MMKVVKKQEKREERIEASEARRMGRVKNSAGLLVLPLARHPVLSFLGRHPDLSFLARHPVLSFPCLHRLNSRHLPRVVDIFSVVSIGQARRKH